MNAPKTEKELIEMYGGIALEKQFYFESIVGQLPWNIDIPAGKISFGEKWTLPFQLLGTFSHSSETFLWGWANEGSNIPEALLDHANKMGNYGDEHEIDLLSNDEFEATQNDLHLIGLIATGIFNETGYYLGNYGPGTICVVINSDEINKSRPDSHETILTVFPRLISLFEMNHKNALAYYLLAKKYDMQEDASTVTGTKNGKTIKGEFDELGRLTKLNG